MTLKSKILTNKTKILNFSSKKIGVFILESRSWSKKTIISFFKETKNLHVVISFLLFIFGVFMPIKLRYGDQFVSFFFKNNLPAISIPYSQISWETFEYLISNYFDLDKNILNQNTKIKNVLPLSVKIKDLEREISKSQFLENKKNGTFQSPSIQSIDRVKLEDFKTSIARESLPISTFLDEHKQNKLNNKIIDSEKSKFQTKFLKNINFSFIEKDPTIERVDIYNDSILIQTNSIWNQQQKQNYIGFFPKKNSSLVQNIKNNDWVDIHNPINIKNLKLNEDLKIKNYNTSPFHKSVFGKKWYSISNRNITLPFLSKTSEINKIFIDKTFSPNNKLVDSTNWRQNFSSNLDELPLKVDTGFFKKNVNRSEIEKLIPINHKLQLLPIYKVNKKTLNGLECSNRLKIPFSFSKFQNKILYDQKNIKWSESLNKINDQLLACKKHTPNIHNATTITNTKQSKQNSDVKYFQIEDFKINTEYQMIDSKIENFKGQQNNELTPVEGCKIEDFNKEKTTNKIKNLEVTNYQGLQGIENFNQIFDLHNSQSKKLVTNNNLTKLNFLQRELKLLFNNQKIIPFNNFKLTEKIFQQPRLMSGYRYPDMNKNDIYEYKLNNLYKTKLAQFLKFQKQSPISESNHVIKIWLPPSLVSESKYNLSTLELNPVPSFQLKYRATLLEDTEKNDQPIYDGPGISLNSITKDLDLLNQKKVLKWTSKYLASDNPLTDRKINFLGLESTTESSDTESSIEEEFTKNSMFPDKLFTNQKKFYFISKINKQNSTQQPNPSVISTKINKKVAFLEEKEWYDILEIMKPKWEKAKAEQNLESEKDSEIDIVLPFVTMFQPTGKKIFWPLTHLDYQSSQLPKFQIDSEKSVPGTDLNTYFNFNESLKPKKFEIGFNTNKVSSINKSVLDVSKESSLPYAFKIKDFNGKPMVPSIGFSKIINHSFPFSKTLLERNIIENTNLNAIYQRIPTIFNAKQSNIFTDPHNRFRDSWEPLTTEPLSIVTQIYFALFCLKILQSYYKKYGKEVISYIINIIELLGILDDNLKDELQLNNNEDFRLIKKTEKRFKDIAGIEKILPELSEIVWLLRNKKLNLFKLRGSIIPKGILLVGPPGTGKTLLVQAIAGEAEVPVLVQSGSSLIDPEKSENGTEKLKHMFDRARELAPCILFIDEIDTLGQKRQNVMQNPMGADALMESLHKVSINSRNTTPLESNFSGDRGNKISKFLDENEYLPETSNENREFLPKSRNNSLSNNSSTTNLSIAQQSLQEEQNRRAITHERLSLLMQFLVEMDGLSPRQGVIVIGATNRPAVLDRAFTRPGRFDQILHLAFPGKEKRIDILKLYSQNLGIDKNVSWDYFGNRTAGFSAADLSAIMNQSSIQAILKETIHSIDSIEHGIDFITSYGIEKPTIESYSKLMSNGQKYKDPFFVSRLAYYQAGKAVLYTMLPEHPPAIVLHFWPYSKKIRKNSHQFLLKNYRRVELETQMIGLYAGKAAEILALCGSSFYKNKKTTNINCYKLDRKFSKSKIFQRKLWDSDLGNADLRIASSLGYSMINNWFLYSKKISIRKENQIITNQNTREIREIELFRFLNKLAENDENQLKDVKEAATFKKPDTLKKKDEPVLRIEDYQKWSFSPWWQYQVTNQIYLVPPTENDWYRIFLPDPQQTERNDEWIPPDQYWHNKENFSNLLSSSLELKKKNMKKLTVKPKKKTVCDETFQKNDQYNVLTALKSSILSGKSKNSYGKTASFVTWNNLYKLDRDYIYHSLVMLCFNKAFCLLEENRELLDYFAYYLIRFKTIRQNDIITIFSKFGLSVLAKQELIPDSFNKNTKKVNESGTRNLSTCFKITKFKTNKES